MHFFFSHPIKSEVATVVTVSGAVSNPRSGSPPAAIDAAFKLSIAYFKKNGTPTLRTFDPTRRPTASLTRFLMSGSS